MSVVRELPLVQLQPIRSAEWLHAAKRARQLSWLSLAWMGAEGTIGVVTGVLAGSIALTAFGIQSFIEGFASLVIVWLFTGARLTSNAAEGRAQKFVAVQFFLLVPFVGYEALSKLLTGERADTSWLGIGLVTSSLIGMPLLGIAKRRLADRLGSAATRGEGTQNLLCASLAGAVLLGLLGTALLGWWWLDPIAALVLAAVSIREGLASWRGEGCCASC
ncbi:MAG TPA: cation transporter [Gaiellaceae bacterium]|nr:cation transporter [Gaiellaceae bacterium]